MRAFLPATLLLSVLLAACASTKDVPPSKHISQSGPLKVHPGLLGQAIPPELQFDNSPSTGKTPVAGTNQPAPEKNGQPAQRSFYFDLDSAEIRREAGPLFAEHAQYLIGHPRVQVHIEGHADERGSSEYNHRLGLKRADTVRAALIALGVAEKQISVSTLGAARPKVSGSNEESWAANRRADIIYEKTQ